MPDVNKNGYTVIFAAISCLICSALLSGTNVALKDLQDKNMKVDKQRNVLMAASLATAETTADEVSAWFTTNENGISYIKTVVIDIESGMIASNVTTAQYLKKPKKFPKNLVLYECIKEGQQCFILPVEGVGLWGKLYGFLALKQNGDDVIGISFYQHKETPGLGAEITEPWFTSQFSGKKLLTTPKDFSSFRGIEVRKGLKVVNLPEKDQPYCVDGISGATITSKGVTGITQKYLKQYIPYLKNKI